jgi:hypothetical protein
MMENDVYLPWLKSKVKDKLPALIEHTYHDVSIAMEQTLEAARNVVELNDADNVDKLRVKAIYMVQEVNFHLDEVEQLYPHILGQFSVEDGVSKQEQLLEDRGG